VQVALPELRFRLGSLQRLYPDYVPPQLAETWGNELNNRQELSTAQLRDFQVPHHPPSR
jgi:hypothetical protein